MSSEAASGNDRLRYFSPGLGLVRDVIDSGRLEPFDAVKG